MDKIRKSVGTTFGGLLLLFYNISLVKLQNVQNLCQSNVLRYVISFERNIKQVEAISMD